MAKYSPNLFTLEFEHFSISPSLSLCFISCSCSSVLQWRTITETIPATMILTSRCTDKLLHLPHLFIPCTHSLCTQGSVSKVIRRRLRWPDSPPTSILLLHLHHLHPLVSSSHSIFTLLWFFYESISFLVYANFTNGFRVCLNCVVFLWSWCFFFFWFKKFDWWLTVQQDWASGLPLNRNIELLLRWVLIWFWVPLVTCSITVVNVNWIMISVTFWSFYSVMEMFA